MVVRDRMKPCVSRSKSLKFGTRFAEIHPSSNTFLLYVDLEWPGGQALPCSMSKIVVENEIGTWVEML